MFIISTFVIFYDYDTQKGCIAAMIVMFYSILTDRVKPNDNIMVQRTEYYSNAV